MKENEEGTVSTPSRRAAGKGDNSSTLIFLWATPLFPCVQKAHIEIQREVAERRGVNVRAAAVLILQIAGEPGEGEFFVWLAIWRGCKRSKAERLSLIAKRVRRRLIMTLKLLLLREKHCPSVLNRQSECLCARVHTCAWYVL